MKKRTKITIILFAIFGIGLGVYLGLMENPETKELRERGVRAVFDDEKRFAQELQIRHSFFGFPRRERACRREGLLSNVVRIHCVDGSLMLYHASYSKKGTMADMI